MIVIDKLNFSTRSFNDQGGADRETITKSSSTGPGLTHSVKFKSQWLLEKNVFCAIRYGKLNIEYSPSSFATKGIHNLTPVSAQDIKSQIIEIQNHLNTIGVVSNLLESQVKRIDLAIDKQMNFPIKHYTPYFAMLRITRGYEKRISSTTYSGNKHGQIVFYDKSKQLIKKKNLIAYTIKENVLRCEQRLEKKEKIISILGSDKIEDVLFGLPKLSSFFKEQLSKTLTWN